MSNIAASPKIDQCSQTDMVRFLTIFMNNVVNTVNGDLDFQTNFNCKLVDVSFTAINQDIAVNHGLGRVPSGRIIYAQSANGLIIDGLTQNTSSILYLRCSALGKASLIVF